MKEINIGFDLGVASIGWSVFDQTNNKLVDYGVKIFEQSAKAEDRRGHRSLRRRYNRQNHRIERFEQLLEKYKLTHEVTSDNELLGSRIRALNEEVDISKVLDILRFFLKYRGYSPFADDTRDNIYKVKYPQKYACEIQKIILEEQGHYRGIDFPFLIRDFQEEIAKILKTQSLYNSKLSEGFIKEYFAIFNSRREFWEGPGGKRIDQLTPFGRYKKEEDLNKEVKYLFEELIKDCSVYVGEKSVPVNNYYAQKFNFLNDMINMRIPIEYITEKYLDKVEDTKTTDEYYFLNLTTINEIEKMVFENKTVSYEKILKKILGLNKEQYQGLKGLRVAKNGKFEITKFAEQKKVINKFKEVNYPIDNIIDINNWNQLIYILTVSPAGNLKKMLEMNMSNLFSSEEIELLSNINLADSQYHSYSEKALIKYIELMEDTLKNSSTVERQYTEQIKSDVKKLKIENYFDDVNNLKMSAKYVDDLVASPQVKKSLRKAITTSNQILEKYNKSSGYRIKNIIIESNRELNNTKRVNEIIKEQGGNQKIRDEARIKIEQFANSKNNISKLIEKQLLLDETNGKCINCDTIIDINSMEVEHALPISKSADNSFANKVASCKECNSNKGDKTYYQYIGEASFEHFKNKVLKLKISDKKKENLLFTESIDKYGKKFINRNLRDTSYATKEFTNQIKLFFEAVEYKTGQRVEAKVITMPPAITKTIREYAGLEKDRAEHYHHAVDASICAMYPTSTLGKYTIEIQTDQKNFWKIPSYNDKLNQMIKHCNYEDKLMSNLKNIGWKDTRFAFEVKRNTNGQLWNADISKVLIDDSGKKKEYKKVEYISNIYELEGKKLIGFYKMLNGRSSKKLGLVERKNPVVHLLIKIYDEYHDVKWRDERDKEITVNPFIHYQAIQNEVSIKEVQENLNKYGIRIPTKKGNGPIVKRVNYTSVVSNPQLLNKKKLQMKKGNHLMVDSVKSAYIEVYRGIEDDQYYFVPVALAACDLTTGKIKQNSKIYQEQYQYLIGANKVEKLFNLRSNEYVRFVKKNGEEYEARYRGHHKRDMVLNFKNNKSFGTSDISIEKIPIYGLGRKNLRFDEEKK